MNETIIAKEMVNYNGKPLYFKYSLKWKTMISEKQYNELDVPIWKQDTNK